MKVLAASFVVALASPAWAGVLTVGPAGQFAQVTDALAAAQPGDAILVAAGTYDPFVVDKAVRVLGAGAGVTTVEGFGASGIAVVGIPLGAEAVVSGFAVHVNAIVAPIQASVVANGCDGTVVFSDLVVDSPIAQVALVAQQSERVVLHAFRALLEGPAGTQPGTSVVRVAGGELWVVDSTITAGASGGGFTLHGSDAVGVTDGTLRLWTSQLVGGDGVGGKGIFVVPHGGHAVRASGSDVVVYGGPGATLAGGDGAFGMFATVGGGGSALALENGSNATVQDQTPLVPGVDATGAILAPFVVVSGGSGGAFDAFVHPTLDAPAQTATGGSIAIDAAGHPGAIVAVLVAFHSGPTLQFPGIEGVTFLDPTLFVHPVNALLDPVGVGSTVLGVPALPELVGAALHLQGVQFNGGGISLTNPATVAVVR